MSSSVYGVAWREWKDLEIMQGDPLFIEEDDLVEKKATFSSAEARDRFYYKVQDQENFCDFTDHWSEVTDEQRST
jgi:hypothetical protein